MCRRDFRSRCGSCFVDNFFRRSFQLRPLDGIFGKDGRAVALYVEDLNRIARILWQAQSLAQHISQGWGRAHADFDEALNTQTSGARASSLAGRRQQQVLGFNPPHR